MKKYIYGFLLSSAALLAIAPIANIKHEIDSGKKSDRHHKQKHFRVG